MSRSRPHVLIAGGGVAGLETLLALRALAADVMPQDAGAIQVDTRLHDLERT